MIRLKVFGDANNQVDSTVADVITQFGELVSPGNTKVLEFQAAYWDGSDGKDLKIYDSYGDEILHVVSDGTAGISQLASQLTVSLPLSYLTDEAGKKLRIYGKVTW